MQQRNERLNIAHDIAIANYSSIIQIDFLCTNNSQNRGR
jgi:hypothetical protein